MLLMLMLANVHGYHSLKSIYADQIMMMLSNSDTVLKRAQGGRWQGT